MKAAACVSSYSIRATDRYVKRALTFADQLANCFHRVNFKSDCIDPVVQIGSEIYKRIPRTIDADENQLGFCVLAIRHILHQVGKPVFKPIGKTMKIINNDKASAITGTHQFRDQSNQFGVIRHTR